MFATQFRYSLVDPHMKSRDLKSALVDLTDAGLLYQIHASAASGLPSDLMMSDNQ